MSEPQLPPPSPRHRAWDLLRQIVGVVQIGAGIGIFLNGPATFTLPQFEVHADAFPWWWWGITAVASGALFFVKLPRVRLVGLCSSALWWTVWSALLIYGIVKVGQPLVSAFSYLLIIAVHITLAIVEWIEQRA